jgi:hypothetical protein
MFLGFFVLQWREMTGFHGDLKYQKMLQIPFNTVDKTNVDNVSNPANYELILTAN